MTAIDSSIPLQEDFGRKKVVSSESASTEDTGETGEFQHGIGDPHGVSASLHAARSKPKIARAWKRELKGGISENQLGKGPNHL